MRIVILANDELKEELKPEAEGVRWIEKPEEFSAHADADAYIDLLFENNPERVELLGKLLPRTVIINSVIHPLSEIGAGFIRINGWPTFLKGELVEASAETGLREQAEKVLSALGKKTEWITDQPGFITPRVIGMIINEAYFSLAEQVSSREDIDTAMKLGTNYPYGPFEWAEKIGKENVYRLLKKLSVEEKRYTPCETMTG
ncbi:MAG TPA: 3-hydroxyacyl-CoA dehydrogenase family protein [Flavisolibacter sp.]|jgi:3-hydroxybutyryl-CoA dehydrogenase